MEEKGFSGVLYQVLQRQEIILYPDGQYFHGFSKIDEEFYES